MTSMVSTAVPGRRSSVAGVIAGAVLLLGSARFGSEVFAVVVVVLAVAGLVDLVGLLSRVGMTPVVPAAAVPALVLPILAAVDPGTVLDRLPGAAAALIICSFSLVLLFGRRRGVTGAVAATALVGLVVGVGATSLVALQGAADGTAWLFGVVVLITVAEMAAAVVEARRVNGASMMRVVAAAVAGLALSFVLPTLSRTSLLAVALVVALASDAGGRLRTAEAAGMATSDEAGAARSGAFNALVGLLLAAPAVYLLAEAVRA